jgi:hypothetical protein
LVSTAPDGIKSVAYGNLTAVLVEAVKDLKRGNDALAVENARLQARLVRLEDQMSQLAASKLTRK